MANSQADTSAAVALSYELKDLATAADQYAEIVNRLAALNTKSKSKKLLEERIRIQVLSRLRVPF